MFCPECGSKNEDNAVFCNNCGMRLQEAGIENPSAPKKREPLTSGDKILLAELSVAILSVIIFIVVYNMQYGAKNIAEKHVKAFFEEDWNTVYDTMYVDGADDFMDKEAFVTAQQINETGEKQHVAVMSVNKISGGFSSRAYHVVYRTEDYSDTMTVEMKRKGLLWKVDDSDIYIIKNYTVSVPAGAKVSVDKIDVSKSVKPSEKLEGYDTYVIPKVFGMTHYVELSGEELESSGQLHTGYNNGNAEEDLPDSIIKTGYNEETIEKVMKQAESDIEEILNAASENKRFSEVSVFEDVYAKNKEYVIDGYEYLRDSVFGNGNSKYTLTKYQITNGEMNGSLPDYYEDSVVKVDIKGNYSYANAYIYWDGDIERDDGEGTCSHSLYYINDGGTWKLYDMEMDMGGVY